MLCSCFERKAPHLAGTSRVPKGLRLSRARIPGTRTSGGSATSRDLPANATKCVSGRLPPRGCDLQCLTTSQKPHETAKAEALPAAAWPRRNHLVRCSRILSRQTCSKPRAFRSRFVDVDQFALERCVAIHIPAVTGTTPQTYSPCMRSISFRRAPLGDLGRHYSWMMASWYLFGLQLAKKCVPSRASIPSTSQSNR